MVEGIWGMAALTGLVAGFWGKIKAFGNRILSLFVVHATLGDGGDRLELYIWKHMKRSWTGDRKYGIKNIFIRSRSRNIEVGYEELGSQPIIFWSGWRPLILSRSHASSGNNTSNGAVSPAGSTDSGTSITFIRGLFDLDEIMSKAIDYHNSLCDEFYQSTVSGSTRFSIIRLKGNGSLKLRMALNNKVTGTNETPKAEVKKNEPKEAYNRYPYRFLKYTLEDMGEPLTEGRTALSGLALSTDVEEVVLEVIRWKASEKWYKKKDIPWRRGLLLYGVPGTGKSSLIRAIGQDLGLPIYVFDLSSMSNEEFIESWLYMKQNVPCIALMEDMDNVFHKRTNILGDDGGGLSFDCFLNVLSGVERSDGVFLAITTNCLEKLDDAIGVPTGRHDGTNISTRPGRIDRVIELKALTYNCRVQLATRILSDCPEKIEDAVQKGDGYTGAQFQEYCSQIALSDFWMKQKHGSTDVHKQMQMIKDGKYLLEYEDVKNTQVDYGEARIVYQDRKKARAEVQVEAADQAIPRMDIPIMNKIA